jgi:hypothetical protein
VPLAVRRALLGVIIGALLGGCGGGGRRPGPEPGGDGGAVAPAGIDAGAPTGADGGLGEAEGGVDGGAPEPGGADGGGAGDGGATAQACEGLLPVPGAPGELSQEVPLIPVCLPAEVEGGGSTVGAGIGLHVAQFQLYPATGGPVLGAVFAARQDDGPPYTAIVPSSHGYHAVTGVGPASTVDRGEFAAYDASGKPLASGADLEGAPRLIRLDPAGGSVLLTVAGPLSAPLVYRLEYMDAGGHRRAATVVDRDVDTVAVGSGGDVLVVAGAAARWYDGRGAPLTAWFAFADGAVPPPVALRAFEPVAGGAVALRENDAWLLLFRPGAAQAEPAPGWLASRAATEAAVIRGGRATALVTSPVRAPGTCGEPAFEVLAESGESCGMVHLGADPACHVHFGRDGTVSTLGVVRSTAPDGTPGQRCTWRWWTDLAR